MSTISRMDTMWYSHIIEYCTKMKISNCTQRYRWMGRRHNAEWKQPVMKEDKPYDSTVIKFKEGKTNLWCQKSPWGLPLLEELALGRRGGFGPGADCMVVFTLWKYIWLASDLPSFLYQRCTQNLFLNNWSSEFYWLCSYLFCIRTKRLSRL